MNLIQKSGTSKKNFVFKILIKFECIYKNLRKRKKKQINKQTTCKKKKDFPFFYFCTGKGKEENQDENHTKIPSSR
jgi:hypothetical protein